MAEALKLEITDILAFDYWSRHLGHDRDLRLHRQIRRLDVGAPGWSVVVGVLGTRREELLFGPAVAEHQTLRRSIARKSPREAMLAVLKLVDQYPTNESLLAKF